MSLHDVIRVLVAHWDDTVTYLESADLRLIAELTRQIEVNPDDDQTELAVAELMALLIARLPYRHLVLDAITTEPRLDFGPADWSGIATALRTIPDIDVELFKLSWAAGDAAAPVSESAETRLLTAAALTVQQVRDSGSDPDRADLIRLSPQSGVVQLPAFQFGRDGRPIPVVLAINRLLQAAEDPWGVADWWLGGNAWLDGIPATLLGYVDDELLTRAAQAEFPEG